MKRIGIIPKVSGVGGMVSFQAKLIHGLAARNIQHSFELDDALDSLLVIGGTRHLGALRQARRRNIPVVQRLDGINWLHRRMRTGPLHWLRAERGNRVLAHIRSRLATRIVYQSRFVQEWWQRQFGPGPDFRIIHNGVDLAAFTPHGQETPPASHFRILVVEGSLRGGYELGLESAIQLTQTLEREHKLDVELAVAGMVSEVQRMRCAGRTQRPIHWLGVVANDKIPALNRGAHLLYSTDINAACPNSVIEALACGLPVLVYDTGALNELVPPAAGRLVPYGGDPWELDAPDAAALATAAAELLTAPAAQQGAMRQAARQHAEAHLGLDAMVDAYLEALRG
ncbi:MAG: glycosyltransferase family 4 protein [Anaerolineales bacterium]|nr:glycosyltransferase family 4 protein [Anaerolineales bacterium]